MSRKARTAVGLQYGRWGLPTPRARPIFMVMGRRRVEEGGRGERACLYPGDQAKQPVTRARPPQPSYKDAASPLSSYLRICTGHVVPVTKTAKDAPGFEVEVERVHGLVVSELQVCRRGNDLGAGGGGLELQVGHS